MVWPARAATCTGVVLGVVLVAVAAGLSGGAVAQPGDGGADDNGSFGAQVATFMQSTASEANSTVEQGMWRESVDDGDDPDAATRARARRLEKQIATLENRTDRLSAESDGNRSSVAYVARASALRAELATIRESIDDTAEIAQSHGADEAALDELRRRAGNATGPEVAAAARNLTDAGRGPPDWVTRDGGERGPPENPGAGPGNGTDARPGNGTDAGPGQRGPPDDRGDGGPPENGGPPGPPDGAGDGPPADRGDGDDDGGSADSAGSAGSGGPAGSGGSGGSGGPPGSGDTGDGDGTAGSGGAPGSGGGPGGPPN